MNCENIYRCKSADIKANLGELAKQMGISLAETRTAVCTTGSPESRALDCDQARVTQLIPAKKK